MHDPIDIILCILNLFCSVFTDENCDPNNPHARPIMTWVNRRSVRRRSNRERIASHLTRWARSNHSNRGKSVPSVPPPTWIMRRWASSTPLSFSFVDYKAGRVAVALVCACVSLLCHLTGLSWAVKTRAHTDRHYTHWHTHTFTSSLNRDREREGRLQRR